MILEALLLVRYVWSLMVRMMGFITHLHMSRLGATVVIRKLLRLFEIFLGLFGDSCEEGPAGGGGRSPRA